MAGLPLRPNLLGSSPFYGTAYPPHRNPLAAPVAHTKASPGTSATACPIALLGLLRSSPGAWSLFPARCSDGNPSRSWALSSIPGGSVSVLPGLSYSTYIPECWLLLPCEQRWWKRSSTGPVVLWVPTGTCLLFAGLRLACKTTGSLWLPPPPGRASKPRPPTG